MFDDNLEKAYAQVYDKARFLIKLSVPQIFVEAKMKEEEEKHAREEENRQKASQLEEEKKGYVVPRETMRKSKLEILTKK